MPHAGRPNLSLLYPVPSTSLSTYKYLFELPAGWSIPFPPAAVGKASTPCGQDGKPKPSYPTEPRLSRSDMLKSLTSSIKQQPARARASVGGDRLARLPELAPFRQLPTARVTSDSGLLAASPELTR